MSANQIVTVAIAVAGVLGALWVLIGGARGRSRVLGIVGTTMILLGALSRVAFQWMVERFLGRVDDTTIISQLAAVTVLGGVLTGAGLLLVSRAVVVAGWPSKI